MSATQSPVGRARLLAVASPHSGDFLNAIPCSSVGTRLDNSSFRIATALRLGAPICAPHQCVCGENDQYGVHGLSCRRSAGFHSRHSAVNYLIKRALAAATIPARLEPSCLSRNDGKRPDGLTLVPWSHGRCLVWDFTCPDGFQSTRTLTKSYHANSYRSQLVPNTNSYPTSLCTLQNVARTHASEKVKVDFNTRKNTCRECNGK